jgi:hypothetical protein
MKISLFTAVEFRLPIRAEKIYESSPFSREMFHSLCSIVKPTEWNGLIEIDN